MDLNSGSMEYININYNSISFSYRDDRAKVMRGLCRGLCERGYAGRVMWGGLSRRSCEVYTNRKASFNSAPIFCAHIAEDRIGVDVPRHDLVAPPLKKH
jgi:hypothetical protein